MDERLPPARRIVSLLCLPRHSRAYLRHLYMAGEMLASILLTHHNLAFFLDTMRGVRQSIRSGDFPKFRREFTERLDAISVNSSTQIRLCMFKSVN